MKPTINSKEFKEAINVEQMRRSDEYTIKNYTDSKQLMLRAAKGIYDLQMWLNKKIAIVCGSGNNGGDGYALSCLLTKCGYNAQIFRIGNKFSDDGKYYYDMAIDMGVKDQLFCEDTDFKGFDIIVDCIFGTGFKGTAKDNAAKAIEKINSSGAFVISADINSGLNGDTGEGDVAVKSDLTVSIGYYKKGLFLGRAPDLIGDMINVDIGIYLV
ncbi:MAG: NAD(P)H-hydrate epimerase [Clostridia bacterium]|nr:NAD(P)H-hydrate epimerase [Clostridia bacterium]